MSLTREVGSGLKRGEFLWLDINLGPRAGRQLARVEAVRVERAPTGNPMIDVRRFLTRTKQWTCGAAPVFIDEISSQCARNEAIEFVHGRGGRLLRTARGG